MVLASRADLAVQTAKYIFRTYQEAILSRRCVLFTDYQVYFVCHLSNCREAVLVHASEQKAVAEEEVFTLDAAHFQGEHHIIGGSLLRRFTNHIVEYSGRNLTYEQDALPAFTGLLSQTPFCTFDGIPIATDEAHSPETAFAVGLWWKSAYFREQRRDVSLTRRDQFPSWTWAGWSGPVSYPGDFGLWAGRDDGNFMQVNEDVFDTRFKLEDIAGHTQTLQAIVEGKQNTHHKTLSSLRYTLNIVARVYQLRFQARKGKIILCKCHPQAEHDGPVAASDWWEDAVFFEQPAAGNDKFQGILQK
jgi:hypothetical protein